MTSNEENNIPLNVAIIIFDAVDVLDFCGPYEVFSLAGRLMMDTNYQDSGPSATNVFTVAQSERLVRARGGLAVKPDYTIENHPAIDVLIVPGGWGTRREADNPALVGWLEQVS